MIVLMIVMMITMMITMIQLKHFAYQPDLEEFPLPKMDTLPDDPLKVIFPNFLASNERFQRAGGRAVLPGPWRKHQEGSNLKELILLLRPSLPKV